MRIVSLAALTVLELSPPAMVSCAAEAGYRHVGLRLVPATPTEPAYETVGDTPLVREVLARLAATGVRVLDVEILRLAPATRVADFLPVLETAARLGAANALVAGNDPDEARLTDRFAALCDLAAPFHIAPSLEPMPWTDVKSFADGARVCRNARRPNAGLLVDPIHFDRAGSRASRDRGGAGGLLPLCAGLRRARRPSVRPRGIAAPGPRRAAPPGRRRPRPRRHLRCAAAGHPRQRRGPDGGACAVDGRAGARAARAGGHARAAGVAAAGSLSVTPPSIRKFGGRSPPGSRGAGAATRDYNGALPRIQPSP